MATHMVKDQEGKRDVVYGSIAGKGKGYFIKMKSGGYQGPFKSLEQAKHRIQQIKAAQFAHK